MARVLLEAGAGCGKTYTIIQKIVTSIYEVGIAPKDILCLTFTEDAAQEMRERVLAEFQSRKDEPTLEAIRKEAFIGTFHSYCFKLLAPHLYERGYTSTLLSPEQAERLRLQYIKSKLLDFPQLLDLLKWIPNEQSLQNWLLDNWFQSDFDTQSLAQFRSNLNTVVSQLREKLLNFSIDDPEFLKSINFTKKEFKTLEPEIKESLKLYRTLHKQQWTSLLNPEFQTEENHLLSKLQELSLFIKDGAPKHLDFRALEWELYLNPIRPPTLPRLIIVDEFQDTNERQFQILTALSEPTTQWFFVGDPKQSIYKFRGGDVRVFKTVQTQIQTQELDTSRRSLSPLVDFSNALQDIVFPSTNALHPKIQKLKWIAEKEIPKASPEHFVHYRVFQETDFGSSTWGPSFLNDYASCSQKGSAALLFRSWKKLFEASHFLTQKNIPHKISGNPDLYAHHLTSIFYKFLFWVYRPDSTLHFLNFSQWCPHPMVRDENLSLLDRSLELHKYLSKTYESLSQLSFFELFTVFVEIIQVQRWEAWHDWVYCCDQLIRNWEQTPALLIDHLGTVESFESFFKALNATETPFPENSATLTLSTIHGSKGLEYDFVFIADLYTKGRGGAANVEDDEALSLPIRRDGLTSLITMERNARLRLELEAEQSRLFYVAWTRAKQKLYFYFRSQDREAKDVDELAKLKSEIFKLPTPQPIFWDTALLECLRHPSLQYPIDLEQFESTTGPDNSVSHFLWRLPAQASQTLVDQKRQPMQRLGIRKWIDNTLNDEEEDFELKKQRWKLQPQKKRSKGQDSVAWGLALHSFLELWDGNNETQTPLFQEVLKKFPEIEHERFQSAISNLLQIPLIDSYFEVQKNRDSQERVYKEFPITLIKNEAWLSGILDVLWMRSPEHFVILDWKTTFSMYQLKSSDSLEKIALQLNTYRDSFKQNKIRIDLYAIGIDFKTSQCEIIWQNLAN